MGGRARSVGSVAVVVALAWLACSSGCSDGGEEETSQPATGSPGGAGGSAGTSGTGLPPPGGGPAPALNTGGAPAMSPPPVQMGGTGGTPAMEPVPAADASAPPASDAGMAVADAAMEPTHEDLGEGDGHDVITIGDSWMSLGTAGIQQSLVKISGQPYRTYGVGGTRLLNGQIPGQYDQAKRANADIKTVVMTGGGNDILQTGLSSDCASGGDSCRDQLIAIAEGLSELWAQMGEDGVQDVIHILYSSDAGSGVAESIRNAGEMERRCAEAPLRCHLLPTDDLVMGDLRSDGIHPSNAAYDRIATGVYELMMKEGMRR